MNPSEVDLSALDRVPAETWQLLAQQRTCFAHQSVGGNILAGVNDILSRKPEINLHVHDWTDQSQSAPGLAHWLVGRNEDPQSKFDGFATSMASAGSRQAPDMAMLKICYVDIDQRTDPERLAAEYIAMMSGLQRDHPQTTFVFVTAPLTTVESGLKTRVKRILGKPRWGYGENERREQFNALVRRHCTTASVPLFDLARIESTLPDGRATWFRSAGVDIPCLAECFTGDGGHLNETGRLVAAREFLLLLAREAEARAR